MLATHRDQGMLFRLIVDVVPSCHPDRGGVLLLSEGVKPSARAALEVAASLVDRVAQQVRTRSSSVMESWWPHDSLACTPTP